MLPSPEAFAELGRKHGLVLLYLFGSRAKGTAAAESDWDFAALFDERAGGDLFARAAALELDLLGLIPDRVQVTPLNEADPVLKFEVIEAGRPCFARSERDRILFEASVMREYRDSSHRRRIYAEGTRRWLARREEKGAT